MGDELATIEYLREQVRSISKLASDARQERDQALEENQRVREELKGFKDDDGVSGTPEGDYFWNVTHLQADLTAAREELTENEGVMKALRRHRQDAETALAAARAKVERLRGALKIARLYCNLGGQEFVDSSLAREDGE